MLSTIERVLLLRTVGMFAEAPGDVLADVAALMREVHAAPGQRIIEKGELGTAMYILVTGSARAHDGDVVLATMGERDVFGELAALDPEPRSASVTAEEDSVLLALEHAPLMELIGDRPEIARGVIRFLCQRVRARP
jgi:CRP-like cAMP-binding protein